MAISDAHYLRRKLLADAIRARPSNLRQAAIEVTREALIELEAELAC
jgi:hypothetical protein